MDDFHRRRRAQKAAGTHPKLTDTTLIPMIAKIFSVNWKTTQGGIASIGAGLGLVGTALQDGLQVSDVQLLLEGFGLISVGVSLLFARDADKSSQDNGVRAIPSTRPADLDL